MRLLLLLAFLLIPAGAARAAETPVLTTSQGTTLSVADVEQGLDLKLSGGSDIDADDTGQVPLWPNESVVVTNPVFHTGGPVRMVVGGAVNAAVASVELRFGPEVLRLPTVAGDAYQGRSAGQVRFFSGEADLTLDDWADPLVLRQFDAAGTLLSNDDEQATSRKVPLIHHGTLRIDATLISSPLPLPLAPEHRDEQLCLAVQSGRGRLLDADDRASCQQDPALQALELGGSRGCGASPTTLTGVVPAAAREVVAVLGDGRRVHYRTRTTPFGLPQRIVAAILPRGEAVRRVLALGARGGVLARGDIALAPPDRRCVLPARDWYFESDAPDPHYGTPPGTQVAAADPSGPRLLVRDRGLQVCLGIDALALDSSDCDNPQVNSRYSSVITRRYPDGRIAVGGMFAAPVTTLKLELAGGGQVTVPATESAGYLSPYRTTQHFAFVVLARGQTPRRGALLDAAGRTLGEASTDLCTCHASRPLRTVLTVDHFRLVAGRNPCIAVAVGRERLTDCTEYPAGDGVVHVFSSCTRRTVLYGLTQHTVSRIELELAGGGTVNARIVRLGRYRAFLAVLPPSAGVRGVRFAGVPHEDTVPTPIPPASEQCGYAFRGVL